MAWSSLSRDSGDTDNLLMVLVVVELDCVPRGLVPFRRPRELLLARTEAHAGQYGGHIDPAQSNGCPTSGSLVVNAFIHRVDLSCCFGDKMADLVASDPLVQGVGFRAGQRTRHQEGTFWSTHRPSSL